MKIKIGKKKPLKEGKHMTGYIHEGYAEDEYAAAEEEKNRLAREKNARFDAAEKERAQQVNRDWQRFLVAAAAHVWSDDIDSEVQVPEDVTDAQQIIPHFREHYNLADNISDEKIIGKYGLAWRTFDREGGYSPPEKETTWKHEEVDEKVWRRESRNAIESLDHFFNQSDFQALQERNKKKQISEGFDVLSDPHIFANQILTSRSGARKEKMANLISKKVQKAGQSYRNGKLSKEDYIAITKNAKAAMAAMHSEEGPPANMGVMLKKILNAPLKTLGRAAKRAKVDLGATDSPLMDAGRAAADQWSKDVSSGGWGPAKGLGNLARGVASGDFIGGGAERDRPSGKEEWAKEKARYGAGDVRGVDTESPEFLKKMRDARLRKQRRKPALEEMIREKILKMLEERTPAKGKNKMNITEKMLRRIIVEEIKEVSESWDDEATKRIRKRKK